jgi:hypothetical protein
MAAVDRLTISVNCSGPGSIPLPSKTNYNIAALTAGNFATQATKITALEQATEDLTDGVVSATSVAINTPINSGYPAGVANRGSKWILSATNAALQPFTYTIPAAPGAGELNSDNETANLTGTNWAAYKTAFEAVATDPNAGALTLKSARLGGRRR